MPKAKAKTTISVPEMARMLGLKKTDSYWLVHKNLFETVQVAGKMRIVLSSFEKWYATQTHYKKVNGPEPGKALKAASYSAKDIAEKLGICEDTARETMKKSGCEILNWNNHWRVTKKSFDSWLKKQDHYRTQEQRETDRYAEECSMTIPEMGRLICVDRNTAYSIVDSTRDLLVIKVAGQRRVTKDSFEKWYAGQDQYKKFADMTKEERKLFFEKHENDILGRTYAEYLDEGFGKDLDKEWYSIEETAQILGTSRYVVHRLIKDNRIAVTKFNRTWRISKEDIVWFREAEERAKEEENENGINH